MTMIRKYQDSMAATMIGAFAALSCFTQNAAAQPIDMESLSRLLSNPEEASSLTAILSAVYGDSFSWPMIIGNLIFSTVGFFALIRGWKQKRWQLLWLGIGLSAFPWFVSNVYLFYGIGAGLCFLLYRARKT